MIKQQFIIILTPPRKNFLETITSQETGLALEHFEYYKMLMAGGYLLLAGRTDTAEFGIGIFQAENIEQLKELLDKDPAVTAGMFTYTVHPFSTSLIAAEYKV